MPNNNAQKFQILERNYARWRKKLPRKVATTAVNFFKRNFQRGGFVDKPFKKWDVPNKKVGKTLVKSGNLRRSIRKRYVSHNRIIVGSGSEIPYAEIHNEGGKITPTPKQRRYFWAMYKQTNEDHWKAMALAKEINIPKRQFIGDSKALPITINRMIIKELKTILK